MSTRPQVPAEVFEGNKGFMESIAGRFEIDWADENLEIARRTILKRYNAEIHSHCWARCKLANPRPGKGAPVAERRPDTPPGLERAPWRPNRGQLAAAWDRRVPDVIAPDLDVLFVGINPGLWSGAVGHHFAHPSSRFWKALHASGFTPRLLSPFEEADLLAFGLGLTNLVDRATASARDLSREELRSGARVLERKVARHHPRWVALLGVGAYRTAFDRPEGRVGRQPDRIAGSDVWVLPGPSGLNAHYPMPAAIEAFRRFHEAAYGGRE